MCCLCPVSSVRPPKWTLFCTRTTHLKSEIFVFADSGSSSAWSPLFNGAPATGANGTKAQAPPTPTQQLDTDTINFIHRIYCRECRMEAERKAQQEAASGGGTAAAPGDEAAQQQQPPQAAPPTSPMWQVEEASLAMTMDTNKECELRFVLCVCACVCASVCVCVCL